MNRRGARPALNAALCGRRVARAVALLGAIAAAGCMPIPQEPPVPPGALAVGEAREVELYAIRLDVSNFEEVVTKADILALPQSVRDSLWLQDLDLTGDSGTPRLLDNAMAAIRALKLDDPALTQSERNMIRLLNMTPDTSDLRRTQLEEMLSIAPKVGFAAEEVLADAAGIGVEQPFLSDQSLTEAVVAGVIGTHPNAQQRPGRKTASNPDGIYPVARGLLPVTLEDAASDMASLSVRFGEFQQGGRYHPGFMVGTTRAEILSDDFKMILKANANALPFKGVDLTNASRGNVSSIGKDGGELFDFSDPDWLRIEGLNPDAVVEEMTFQILEHPDAFPNSAGPLPSPMGNSPVWTAPPWTLERIVAEAGFASFAGRNFSRQYFLKDPAQPLFTLTIEQGYMSVATLANLGSPPPPMFMWDLMLEVAQARLHDGPDPAAPAVDAIPEGEGHVRFTLRDVPIGVASAQIAHAIRTNLEDDPSSLISAAGSILDQRAGQPDFFLYQPRSTAPQDVQGDWLYFIHPDDIPTGDDGLPVWAPTGYPTSGFYKGPELSEKISDFTDVEGDVSHDKVRVNEGDVLYCADHEGAIFRIDVLTKPSPARLTLRVTRVM